MFPMTTFLRALFLRILKNQNHACLNHSTMHRNRNIFQRIQFARKFTLITRRHPEKKSIDCAQVAEAIKKVTGQIIQEFDLTPRVTIILPVDAVGEDRTDSRVYVAKKRKLFEDLKIVTDVIKLPPSISESDTTDVIRSLGKNPDVTGIMVQLPFPTSSPINATSIINQIVVEKDIDGLSMGSKSGLFSMETSPSCIPATPLGILTLLDFYCVPTQGKHVVILGKGQLVGQPLAALLATDPYNATVTSCDIHTNNIKNISRSADILIVAIGSAHEITPDYIKPGAIVIDVGINRSLVGVEDKQIVGDVCPTVYEHCDAYTPVPGGVGLLTVAALAFNTVNSALQQAGFPKKNLRRIIEQQRNEAVEQMPDLSTKSSSIAL